MTGQKHNKSVNISLVFSPLTPQEIFKICKKWEDCRLTIHCCQSLVKWKLSTKTSRELLICRPASQLPLKFFLSFFFLRAHAGALTFELVGGGFLTDPCGSLLLLRVHSGEGTGGSPSLSDLPHCAWRLSLIKCCWGRRQTSTWAGGQEGSH